MRKFDMIIGYGAVKKELKQIADTLKNREYYEKLGVTAPRGLLLHGEPGVGKSLMAAAIIEASGRKAFVCRKDQPNGGFVEYYDDHTYTPLYWELSRIACALGGIAANQWKFGVTDISGGRDLDHAFDKMRDLVINRGICGLHLYSYGYRDANSQNLRTEQEQATAKEIEKIYRKVKEILSLNSEVLEKLADALSRKKPLSAADVQKIKSECKIVPVAL